MKNDHFRVWRIREFFLGGIYVFPPAFIKILYTAALNILTIVMKAHSYIYLVVVVLFSFLLSLNSIKLFSLDEISLFLTVIGLIYGLIAAFTISNAWQRFSAIRDAISEEVYALMSMYIYAQEFSDKTTFGRLKSKLIEYCMEVPEIEWHEYWRSDKTHKKFRDMIRIVAKVKIKNIKDEHLFDEITTELEDAARARSMQLVLSQNRTSKIQWLLNIFLSAIIVMGLVFTSLPNSALSMFVITAMIASVLMILVVLYELDSMKVAEEEVSNEPYKQVVRVIKTE